MKLITKLILGLAAPAAALAALAAATFFFTGSLNIHAVAAQSAISGSYQRTMIIKDMQLRIIQVQQYLTDISATRGQNGLDDGFRQAEEHRRAFLADLDQLAALSESSTGRAEDLAAIRERFEAYCQAGSTMAHAYVENGTEAGNGLMGSFDASAQDLADRMAPLIEGQKLQGEGALAGIVAEISRFRRVATVASGAALLMAVGFSLYMIRLLVAQLRSAIRGLQVSASQLEAAAGTVETSTMEIADGENRQAASVEEVAASLEEMAAMTRQNSGNALEANRMCGEAQTALHGAEEAMGRMAEVIGKVKASSDNTAKVIKTID
nr:methyl-accepting chemotaxis protein [Desulfobacteraceae bacterium]